jgi:beta-lactamase superfamily II metal-dependent hydrolase
METTGGGVVQPPAVGATLGKHPHQDDGEHKDEEGEGEHEGGSHAAKKRKADGITITYYNVGQGNCVLMKNHQTNQAVLVDCGSSEGAGDQGKLHRDTFGKPEVKQDDVVHSIVTDLTKNKGDIVVVVTHLDQDHYNWIETIFESMEKPINFLISSREPIETLLKKESKDGEFVRWVKKKHVGFRHIGSLEDLENALKELKLEHWIKPVAAVPHLKKEVGAAHLSGKQAEQARNADSIVINAISGKCSALLTGDATDASAHEMKRAGTQENLDTTVLLSSHHGADSFGSNSEDWIRKASPKVVVISAGLVEKYGHPRCTTLQRYLQEGKGKFLGAKSPPHELTCYGGFINLRDFKPHVIPQAGQKFGGAEAIYNTFDQGNITVQLNTSESGKDRYILTASHMETGSLKGECGE